MKQLFDSPPENEIKAPKRRFLYILPLALLLAIGILIFTSGRNKFLPLPQYDVAKARLASTDKMSSQGQMLFQAAGWIQAHPYATRATALVSGVVENIYVKDGDRVSRGQVLAKLNDEDLVLELEEAQSILKELELDVVNQSLNQDILKQRINENKALKATAEVSAKKIKNLADRLKKAGDLVSELEKEQSHLEYQEKLSTIQEFLSKQLAIEAEIKQNEQVIAIAQSRVTTQKIKIKKIELNLARTQVRAPHAGIIQNMYARVGRKQMLGSDQELSTTVARIFDPKEISVKVDVPLNVLNKVSLNQVAKVRLESIDEVLDAKVLSLSGEADYQKNTLEVQVIIPGGHEKLRPEMLAQVEFISSAKKIKTRRSDTVFIHRDCLTGNKLFVLNLDGTISQREVELGKQVSGDWQEVISGLQAGQKAIFRPDSKVTDGLKIKLGDIHE